MYACSSGGGVEGGESGGAAFAAADAVADRLRTPPLLPLMAITPWVSERDVLLFVRLEPGERCIR